jgi:hypothetical protein
MTQKSKSLTRKTGPHWLRKNRGFSQVHFAITQGVNYTAIVQDQRFRRAFVEFLNASAALRNTIPSSE